MGRFLFYLSTHWVRHRVSGRERKLRAENKSLVNEIETRKSRVADLTADLEAERVKNHILQLEVDGLTELVECSRKRVEAAIRSFSVADEESDVS